MNFEVLVRTLSCAAILCLLGLVSLAMLAEADNYVMYGFMIAGLIILFSYNAWMIYRLCFGKDK